MDTRDGRSQLWWGGRDDWQQTVHHVCTMSHGVHHVTWYTQGAHLVCTMSPGVHHVTWYTPGAYSNHRSRTANTVLDESNTSEHVRERVLAVQTHTTSGGGVGLNGENKDGGRNRPCRRKCRNVGRLRLIFCLFLSFLYIITIVSINLSSFPNISRIDW